MRFLALAVSALAFVPAGDARAADRVLLFTRAEGYRHESIATGTAMLRRYAPGQSVRLSVTADPRRFTDRGLRAYDAVIFLSATGDVLDPPQEAALERYIRAGGGWLGIHAAADSEYEWPFYQDALLGTRFIGHPRAQRATIRVETRRHPATRHLPQRWTRFDEWYSFRPSPRTRGVRVLLSLDESTYDPERLRMGDHPLAWTRTAGRGRVFYTALGHTVDSYREAAFRRHVLGALRWVLRRDQRR